MMDILLSPILFSPILFLKIYSVIFGSFKKHMKICAMFYSYTGSKYTGYSYRNYSTQVCSTGNKHYSKLICLNDPNTCNIVMMYFILLLIVLYIMLTTLQPKKLLGENP